MIAKQLLAALFFTFAPICSASAYTDKNLYNACRAEGGSDFACVMRSQVVVLGGSSSGPDLVATGEEVEPDPPPAVITRPVPPKREPYRERIYRDCSERGSCTRSAE